MTFGRSAGQKVSHGRYGLGQLASCPVLASTAFTLYEFANMGCNLNLSTHAKIANMVCQNGGANGARVRVRAFRPPLASDKSHPKSSTNSPEF